MRTKTSVNFFTIVLYSYIIFVSMVELRFESRNTMRTFGVYCRHSIVEQQILSYGINGLWRDQVLDGRLNGIDIQTRLGKLYTQIQKECLWKDREDWRKLCHKVTQPCAAAAVSVRIASALSEIQTKHFPNMYRGDYTIPICSVHGLTIYLFW